jgi:membrane protease YdiL (CAAX protease family)
METRQHATGFRAFVQRHPVLVFYVLVFALFGGLLILAGPAFMGTDAEQTSPAEMGPAFFLTVLVANLTLPTAAILVIALAFGGAGLRDLRSRLLRWRVSGRWYMVALLTAPVVMTMTVSALSVASKDFLPAIITADDRASLLVGAVLAGLVAAFFEEIVWTGLATHELSKRHGVLLTGLLVGLPWCLLHSQIYLGTASGGVPRALYVPVMALSVLLPYRVLMVWVYDHTRSLLIAMLMHLAITVSAFVLAPAAAVGLPDLFFNLVFGVTLWVLVAAVISADRRLLSRELAVAGRAIHR